MNEQSKWSGSERLSNAVRHDREVDNRYLHPDEVRSDDTVNRPWPHPRTTSWPLTALEGRGAGARRTQLAAGVDERGEADLVDDDQLVAANLLDGPADRVVGDGSPRCSMSSMAVK